MSDFQEQLAYLRRRIARIDKKYAEPRQKPPINREFASATAHLPFDEVETSHGRHFETEKLYERNRRHGSIGIADLEDLPQDVVDSLQIHFAEELGDVLALTLRGASFREGRLLFGDTILTGAVAH